MSRYRSFILMILFGMTLMGCAKFENIDIKGVKDFKFKGMQDDKILLSLTLDVNNPNPKKIVVKHFEVNAWMNNRELGNMRNTEKIVIQPNIRLDYVVPLEIKLRTAADAFKLLGSGKKLLSVIAVEGYIKGGRFPVVRKIKIPRQTLRNLMQEHQDKLSITDTLSVGSTESN